MAPPPAPATPNPHRFAPSKQSKPPVYLSAQHQTPASTSSQFAPTPRFSFGSQRQRPLPASFASTGHASSSPPVPRPPPLFSFSNSVRKKAEIEDIGSDDEANTQHPSAHHPSPHKTSEIIISDPISPPLPHKRRRLNDAIAISSSLSPSPSPPHSPTTSHHHISSPQTPPPPPTSTHPQPFILSPKRPPSTPHPFILPPRSPSPQPQITHPIFSPHRRGGGPKFLPGGMAHTLRDWVVEIAASVPATRDGEWDLRFRVKDVGGGGGRVSLVEEEGVRGEGKRWMLVGYGEVGRGVVVGVRRPVWEVVVEGEVWGVGVDWGVVDG